jgi:hypothetical protein
MKRLICRLFGHRKPHSALFYGYGKYRIYQCPRCRNVIAGVWYE